MIPPGSDKPEEARMILAVRIRGTVGDSPTTGSTIRSLGLEHKFNARLIPAIPDWVGMLRRAKDLLTWGELEPRTLAMILEKRVDRSQGAGPTQHGLDQDFVKTNFQFGSIAQLAESIISGGTRLDELWKAGISPTFRLHPPKGGFKKSTRRSYNSNGELGYRGPDINRLVKKMI